MGQVIKIDCNDVSHAAGLPAGFSMHIASLVMQLEGLLNERKCLAQGETGGPDATGMAAAPRSNPSRLVNKVDTGARRAARSREVIRQRRLRARFLPAELFAEPAWDMLLDLYAAHYEDKPVSVSSLCIAADVPSTTALRTIDVMTEHGCLARRRDPNDGRRIFITLSSEALGWLDGYFGDLDMGVATAPLPF